MSLRSCSSISLTLIALLSTSAHAQETDRVLAPNSAGAGIAKSLDQQVGAGRGDEFTPDSSRYLIARDPFRSIVRGRQLFQRKFTHAQGLGPRFQDGVGDLDQHAALGAGLSDSCASCHSRPQGSAGVGGNVFTRTTSRDAPHLFGLGLVEMLADEMTADLRHTRSQAVQQAVNTGSPVWVTLSSKGVPFGRLLAKPDGSVVTDGVEGVDPDLRVRPFFAQGETFSIRQFALGAFDDEMGLEAHDPDLAAAAQGGRVQTPSGLVLDGASDTFPAPPAAGPFDDPDGDGIVGELDPALIDHMEFYLLNYFRPARGEPTATQELGRALFADIGCASCHVPDLQLRTDRRVADVDTRWDPNLGNPFNRLFATATGSFDSVDDGSGLPALKPPLGAPFLVEGLYSDLKRHDLGPAFWERDFDGSITKQFVTEPLWGVASTGPYGHDGRSVTLTDVILRHGGEAQAARDAFAALDTDERDAVLDLLGSLLLFPPPATASNLDPGDPSDPLYPMAQGGRIDLSVLFVDPLEAE